LQRRISVVLRHPHPRDWVDAVRGKAQVFPGADARDALRGPEDLGANASWSAHHGPRRADAFAELARRADADSVAFADPALELQWTWRVLGFGDAR